jgi:hypothetical protein
MEGRASLIFVFESKFNRFDNELFISSGLFLKVWKQDLWINRNTWLKANIKSSLKGI